MNLSSKSMQELLDLQKQISEDPNSKLTDSIHLFNKKAQKKLNDIAWAIQEKLAEAKGERIQGATFKN
jgi:hypothetical protein